MINNWSDLVAAIKVWWHAPIKLEPKRPEAMTPGEFKKLPSSVFDILNSTPQQGYGDTYIGSLLMRKRQGEHLTTEEQYRLKMYYHIHQINDTLDHPDE